MLNVNQWPEVCEAQRQLERLEIFMWTALRTRQCSPKQAIHIPLETRIKVIPYLKNLEKLVTSELKRPKWRKGRPCMSSSRLLINRYHPRSCEAAPNDGIG